MSGLQHAFRDSLRTLDARTRELERRTSWGIWRDWSPFLDASTTPPDIGVDGAADGIYLRENGEVTCMFSITFGTVVSAGTGTYRITGWPFTQLAGRPSFVAGDARLFDSSSGNVVRAQVILNDSLQATLRYMTAVPGAETQASATAPWAWAAGDRIEGWLWYPIA